MGGRTSEIRCACKLEESKVFVLVFNGIAFTQHKHDKYSLQTKGQMPADKEIFERHVKLQADSRRFRGARDSITIFYWLRKICVNQDGTCASS